MKTEQVRTSLQIVVFSVIASFFGLRCQCPQPLSPLSKDETPGFSVAFKARSSREPDLRASGVIWVLQADIRIDFVSSRSDSYLILRGDDGQRATLWDPETQSYCREIPDPELWRFIAYSAQERFPSSTFSPQIRTGNWRIVLRYHGDSGELKTGDILWRDEVCFTIEFDDPQIQPDMVLDYFAFEPPDDATESCEKTVGISRLLHVLPSDSE